MLMTIKFDRESQFSAIEIKDVRSARILSPKLVTAMAAVAQPRPYSFFGPCRFVPHCFRELTNSA